MSELLDWLRATIEEIRADHEADCESQVIRAKGGYSPTLDHCEVDLAILDEHAPDDPSDEEPYCRVCWSQRSDFIECDVPDLWPCRTVRLLASGYKHQPGYTEAAGDWKP